MKNSKNYPFYDDYTSNKNIDFISSHKKNNNYEHKLMTTEENNTWNDMNNHVMDINEDSVIYSSLNYSEDGFRNSEEIKNMENNFFDRNINGERNNNSEIYQDNKNMDIAQNRPTNYRIETKKGKSIITGNELTDNVFYQLFQTKETKKEIIEEMQTFRKKRKRRTKEEIKRDKRNKELIEPEILPEKKKGRRKRDSKTTRYNGKRHGKESDDNIIRKIDAKIFKEAIKWINKSFLDNNIKFRIKRKKNDKNIFLKLQPSIINNTTKKKIRMKILNQTFKEILSSYPISKKCKKYPESHNKDLIDRIFQENKQHFIQYILNMTFLKLLNFFNGQITDDIIIEDFKKNYNYNYDEKLIQEFINNFGKIDKFLKVLYEMHIKEGNDEKSSEEYLTRVRVLCLNYKEVFEDKSERSPNKKNNVIDSKDN